MMKVNKITIALLALTLLLVTSACGTGNKEGESSGNAKESASTDAKESVGLEITWAGSQSRHDATLAALDLYSQKNPLVKFEPTYMGFDTYFTKLATLSAAKSLPDIMQIDTLNLMDYAVRNQLAEIPSGIDTSNIDPKLLSAGVINGKQYGIPLGANAIAFLYNKTALDKLGIVVPETGFSWDEWVKVGRETKPKLEKGKYFMQDLSIATGPAESDKYEIYQLAQGKGFIHTPDGKFNIDKDTYIAFNKLFADLREEGVVPPANVSVGHKQYDPQLDNFLNGSILVQRDYAAAFGASDSVNPGQYAFALVPHAAQSGSFMLPSQFFTISQDSDNLDEATKFINWFVNDLEAGQTLKLARGVPVAKPVLNDLEPSLDDSAKKQIEFINKTSPVANPFSSRPKGYGTWNDEWTKVSQAVGFNKMTIDKAYDELQKKWDEIIKL